MQEDSMLTNILSIAGAGLLIFLTGVVFLVTREFIYKYIRFFLPLPPISVAAYIYVYNFYQHYNGDFGGDFSGTTKEILVSVGVITVSFAVFVGLLILFIENVRKLF